MAGQPDFSATTSAAPAAGAISGSAPGLSGTSANIATPPAVNSAGAEAPVSESSIVRGSLAREESSTSPPLFPTQSDARADSPASGHAAPMAAHTTETVGTPASPVPASSFTWGGYFQAIGILIFLLIALWFALRLVRRLGGGRLFPASSGFSRQALRLEAQLPLGPRKGLVVVRFLNKRLLLGLTDQHITLLTEMEAAENEENTQDFQRIMEKAGLEDQSVSPRRPVDAAGSDAGAGRA